MLINFLLLPIQLFYEALEIKKLFKIMYDRNPVSQSVFSIAIMAKVSE